MTASAAAGGASTFTTTTVRSSAGALRACAPRATGRDDHDENGVHPLPTETEAVRR